MIHGKSDFSGIDLRLNDHGVVSTGGDFRFFLDDNQASSNGNNSFEIYNGSGKKIFDFDENGKMMIYNTNGGAKADMTFDSSGLIRAETGSFLFTAPVSHAFLNENYGGLMSISSTTGNVTIHNGMLTVNGNVCASNLTCPSDLRFKNEVRNIDNALIKIMRLRGVNYSWDRLKWPDRKFTTNRQIGFIAQELVEIFPEIVHTDADGYMSVSYDKLTAVLVEAIKEQQVQIQKQNDEIQNLKKMENRISQLEKYISSFLLQHQK